MLNLGASNTVLDWEGNVFKFEDELFVLIVFNPIKLVFRFILFSLFSNDSFEVNFFSIFCLGAKFKAFS
jgi:hypothetical protein